jgi:site-specific DNA-cytosine methylase
MLMLDLYAGRGGASQAMRARGWRVHRVDLDADGRGFDLEERADLVAWSWHGPRPDLVWASPPCTEFARESMPWCRTGATPGMDLVAAAMRIIAECAPRYWMIENVRGASRHLTPLLGAPQIFGPFYLWSNLPPLGVSLRGHRHKESYPSNRPDLRAMVPAAISEAVAVAVESQIQLWEHAS